MVYFSVFSRLPRCLRLPHFTVPYDIKNKKNILIKESCTKYSKTFNYFYKIFTKASVPTVMALKCLLQTIFKKKGKKSHLNPSKLIASGRIDFSTRLEIFEASRFRHLF